MGTVSELVSLRAGSPAEEGLFQDHVQRRREKLFTMGHGAAAERYFPTVPGRFRKIGEAKKRNARERNKERVAQLAAATLLREEKSHEPSAETEHAAA